MVWFHGGGFTNGGTAQALYDGRALAEQSGTVIVSGNYRLGPLGFLAHPALGSGSGNYGIRDQQAALTWVQDNIAAFGGDPGRVTIFGESAGGVSVCLHLVSPASQGLFHRAIQQSGPCADNARTQTQAEAQGADLAEALGCAAEADVAACLRTKSVDEILAALPLKEGMILGEGVSWGPHADGTVLPESPAALFAQGLFSRVKLLLGTNRDEGTLFVWAAGLRLMTKPQYETTIQNAFGDRAAAVLAQYPADDFDSGAAALAEVLGDLAFVCPTRRMARLVAGVNTEPAAYLYHFTREPSFSALPFLGAFHAAEIPFVFGTGPAMGGLNEEEQALSRAMMGYWTRFAATGNPDGGEAPAWAPYAEGSDNHQQLDLTISAGNGLKRANCNFWDGLFQ
jgi:para-nitrobenzyl esterase